MFRIKTYIDADRYGGRGVFAAEFIPAGTVVWRFHPRFTKFIPAARILRLPTYQQEWLATYSYPFADADVSPPEIGVFYNLDNTRFTNHSDNPNTIHPPENGEINIASRDILEGEEVTCDYLEFDPDDVLHGMGIRTCKSFLIEPSRLLKTAS